MPADTVAVNPPPHPLHALATFELTSYRRQLERALASVARQGPAPSVRSDLQARLDAVIAEQEDRRRLADA
jgi:hypothetical protein